MTSRDVEPARRGDRERARRWPRPVPEVVMRPVERFLAHEAASATLLLLAAAIALVWANTTGDSYERFWGTHVEIGVRDFLFEEDLRHLVNDLLMAIFFYVVALEVKREFLFGGLRDRRAAAVPAAAAFGTMVGASTTYVAINLIGDGDLRGWAIPIATDIAFAVGALGVVGRRAPRELRIFMLTLAVVDDLATIAIIALFFAKDISLTWLAAAAALAVVVWIAQRTGMRSIAIYVALAAALWLAVFESGVHATIAGVVLGFLTPAVAMTSRQRTGEKLRAQHHEIENPDEEISEQTLIHTSHVADEGVSPLAKMEHKLHPWSAYGILPVFALANAGVEVSGDTFVDALTGPVGLGVAVGLVIGAPLGGFLFARGIVAAGLGRVPPGLDWAAIGGVTPLKGIGFTVAIFITTLSFDDREVQDESILAILVGSAVAAVIGVGLLLLRHRAISRRAPATAG